jgi:hypothetical protein
MSYDDKRQDAYLRNLLGNFNLPVDKRDPSYNTTKDEAKDDLVELEVDDMLCRDRIHEIVNANIDDISQIVANHRYDVIGVGASVLAYYRDKAKEVAEKGL